jgi:ABC-type transport system substrate-binding protein
MTRTRPRWLVVLVLPVLLAGCLTMDEPQPTVSPGPVSPPPSSGVTPPPTQTTRDPDELVVAVPSLPDRLLPPAADLTASIALDLVHGALYRLDDSLVPVPDLAAGLPGISDDGHTWTIDLALDGVRFGNGRAVTAEDVAGSLAMAGSPVCGLERDLCATALAHLDSVRASDDGSHVVVRLDDVFAPFLAEVLAHVPILDMTALDEAASAILTAAGDMDPGDPDRLVQSIYRAVGADECISEDPPDGCRLADHLPQLEGMLSDASVPLPRLVRYTDEAGQVDRAAYANALLDRVAALGQVLTGAGRDRRAAALGLMDGHARPLGAGAYRVRSVVPDERMVLVAMPPREGSAPPAIERIVFEVVPDPAVAATRLQGGDVDWVPQLDPGMADAIGSSGRPVHAGMRPLGASWVVVFNTRDGRPYADSLTRAAFAACVDRDELTRRVGGGGAIAADTPLAAGSWAMDQGEAGGRAVTRARRLLDMADWSLGSDGIRERDGQRLSTSIALRSSQVRLLAMMQAVADQLRDCGIELLIEDLDVTGDRLLEQLRWPNDFDTLLTLRALGADPDTDLVAFEGRHATSADQEVDANPGGFVSAGMDRRIRSARRTFELEDRARSYREIQDLLATEAPAWFVWYETGWSAVADRVRDADGTRVDPSRPRYELGVRTWSLGPLPVPVTPAASVLSTAPTSLPAAPSATVPGALPGASPAAP